MKTIDLHVHSTYSDGSLTPEELVALALSAGLSAFALTDHDTTDGIDEAVRAARGSGLEIVPGIEFSTRWLHRDIHVLGYFIDYHAGTFQKELRGYLNARHTRNVQMCERIREHTGFPVSMDVLTEAFPDAVITRAHMAAWMVDHGLVETRKIAFDKYLGAHAACFVPKSEVTPADAIRLILAHDGIPVLAHPLLYALCRKQLRLLICELKEAGLMGIEAVYVLNHGSDEAFVRSLAEQYGLLITGGSDFHGKNKPDIALGTGIRSGLAVPFQLLDELKNVRSGS